jgi:hypothetical protein
MSHNVSFPRAVLALFVIPFTRFRAVPRIWTFHLVAANVTGLLFLPRLEPSVLWISILLGLVFMAKVYQRMGFVRLLGAGHALWIAVLPWLLVRYLHLPPGVSPYFEAWLLWVLATDTVCLIIDATDVTAFIRGDRTAYY